MYDPRPHTVQAWHANPVPKKPELQTHTAVSFSVPATQLFDKEACGSQVLHGAQFIPEPTNPANQMQEEVSDWEPAVHVEVVVAFALHALHGMHEVAWGTDEYEPALQTELALAHALEKLPATHVVHNVPLPAHPALHAQV